MDATPAARAAPRSRRGFTLVEVVLAVFVLALALVTSLAALQRAFLNLDTARNLEIAANILQCEMEKQRVFDWAQLTSAAYAPVIDPSFARNPAVGGRFTLSRTVTALAGRPTDMVQVTLTVRWRSYDGRSLSRNYTSIFSRGGLNEYVAAR